jgi:hypothetical protein
VVVVQEAGQRFLGEQGRDDEHKGGETHLDSQVKVGLMGSEGGSINASGIADALPAR